MTLPLSASMFSTARLGLGTASFLPGYGLTQAGDEAAQGGVLTSAADRGIRYFDTAPAYGDAELFVGQTLGSLARDGKVRVATKVIIPPGAAASVIPDSLKRSLDRLEVPSVDTFLWHNATEIGVADLQMRKAFEACREQGLCRRIGGTTYGPAAALAAVQSGWCDTIQFEFSVINPSVLQALTGKKVAGQEWIARSILCKGLLTEAGSQEFDDLKIQQAMGLVRAVSLSRNCPLETVAYAFGFSCPEIDIVLAGARNESELEPAFAVADLAPFTDEEWAQLADADCSECDASHPDRWAALAATRGS
jgi:aryl-alcohol dehydrogenase-like predicted oxidoreductase